MGGCGGSGSERPGLLSDDENDQSGTTPLISTTSGSDSSGPVSGDCTTKTWFGGFAGRSQADLKKLFGYASVVGDFRIEPATSGADIDVTSLRDLTCLQAVYGSVTIQGTSSLSDLTGLDKLRQVQSLNLLSNSGMLTLAGLKQLTVSYTVQVTTNGALTSLGSGIVAAKTLVIQDNPQLSQCLVTALAQTLRVPCSCDGNLDSTTCN